MIDEIVEQEVQPGVIQDTSADEIVAEPAPESEAKQDFSHNAFEDNIKNLREAKAYEAERATKAEYERDQLVKYIDNIQQQLNGGQPPQQQQNELGIKADDYVQGEHLGKVTNEMKQMRDELHQWKQYSEETTAELKLNNEFSDFNDVVNTDSVKSFLKKYPEMRGSVTNNNPLYDRGKATYRLIKKFMGDTAKSPVNKSNQARVQNNTGKPLPTASVNEQQNSPLSKANIFANGYTEDVGDALEKEMYEAISRY